VEFSVEEPDLDPVAGLTRRAREGDRDAFEALARRNFERLFGLAVRICGDEQFARDAVQEAMLAAWRHIGSFRGEAAFDTWIYRITINATYRRMRRRREHPLGEELERMQARSDLATAFRPAGGTASRPDENLERADLRALIAEIIPTLPRKYREAFTMRDLEELNLREIADATGLTVPAVKTRVHRARLRVRAAITERWDVLPYGLTG
jgi:RNA polymerase sigma-70 factor (ECF subfamily)